MTPIRIASTFLLLLFAVASARAADDPDADCPPHARPAPKTTPAASPPASEADAAADGSKSAPITIESDSERFEFREDGSARLCGNVHMRQGDREIKADCLEYDAERESAKLEGGVEFSDPRAVIRGSDGNYSSTLGTTLQGAEFELKETNGRGAARSLSVDANSKVTLEDATYTTCPANDVAWQIRGSRIDLDTRAQNGTVRGASVRFKNVPILYLPWMSFPLGPERKSGFLTPLPGSSSRSGAQLQVPYYWNIRPNLDYTALPVYYA